MTKTPKMVMEVSVKRHVKEDGSHKDSINYCFEVNESDFEKKGLMLEALESIKHNLNVLRLAKQKVDDARELQKMHGKINWQIYPENKPKKDGQYLVWFICAADGIRYYDAKTWKKNEFLTLNQGEIKAWAAVEDPVF